MNHARPDHEVDPEESITVSRTTRTPQPGTRRERRVAERAEALLSRRAHPTRDRRRRSPILGITLLVGAVGIVLVGGLVLLQAGGTPAGTTAVTLTAPLTTTPIALASDRTLGEAAAPVTLEIWSDFQCPVCGEFARTVEPVIIARYVPAGTLRIVQHDAAFQGAKSPHPFDESVEAGAAARCAADQGRYWPFYDWTFANQSGENLGAFAAGRLKSIATAAGLDVPTWQACVGTGQQQAAVRSETSQSVAHGVNATPTMILNGQTIVGLRSVAQLSALIDAAAGG
jgi:protein-disulfide isomerase